MDDDYLSRGIRMAEEEAQQSRAVLRKRLLLRLLLIGLGVLITLAIALDQGGAFDSQVQKITYQSEAIRKQVDEKIGPLIKTREGQLESYRGKLRDRVESEKLTNYVAAAKDPFAGEYLKAVGEIVRTIEFLKAKAARLEVHAFKLKELAERMKRREQVGEVLGDSDAQALEKLLKDAKAELKLDVETVGKQEKQVFERAAQDFFEREFGPRK
ncbi:MAG: hypothetical protein JKY65_31380 [Planctomycetes bacterium]|nr:hypothetical protein [Planctomycetota bacterium]